MSILRTLAGRATEARRASLASRRDPARRRSRPRLESLEGRLVLAGPGATLDVSTAPYFLQAGLPQRESAPEWNSMYGESIAMTPDGNVLAVSSTIREGGERTTIGAVEIWERSGREWSRAATLTPPAESASSVIGFLLSISADGSTVVASAYGVAAPNRSLLVFERDGADWAFRQNIAAPLEWAPGYSTWQRTGLAISGDGDVIALGTSAGLLGTPAESTGRVQVYTRSGDAWGETARLAPPDPASAWSFGISVALSADGATLAVGAGAPTTRDAGPGNVFVYDATPGGEWGAPTAVDGSDGSRFKGERIALSADGKTLLVSGVEDVPGPNGPLYQGTAYIYEETGVGWARTARFAEASGRPADYDFGGLLALSPDGDTAAVAGIAYPGGERMVYVHGRDSGWGRTSVITPAGTIGLTSGLFGGLAASDGDVALRSVTVAGWTVDVYHRPTGFEVILDPSDLATSPGEPTTFLAAATGATGVDVRWQASADGGQTWADIPNAVHDWYTITPTLADSGKMFRAVFTDAHGASATTRPATLTVAPAIPVLTVEPVLTPHAQGYLASFRIHVASDGANPHVPGQGRIAIRVTDAAGLVSVYNGWAYAGQGMIPAQGRVFTPGLYAIDATYEPSSDPHYGPASTKTQMDAPRFDADIQAELSDAAPRQGQEVSLIVRSGAYATGLVTAWNGSVFLGGATLQYGSGGGTRAVIPFRFPHAGIQPVRWVYEGDAEHAPESGEVVADVARVATTIVATPRSGSPIHYFGEEAVYDVVVTTADGRPATGSVTVSIDGRPWETATYELSGDGRLWFRLPGHFAAHGHVLRLRYHGTSNFMPAELAKGFGVYKAPTTLTLATPFPVTLGVGRITLVARVENAKAPVVPVGSMVRFYVDGTFEAEAPVGLDGTATYTRSFATTGTHYVAAVFPETENFQGSASNVVAQHIGRLATVTTLTSTRNPSTAGQLLEFVAIVARAEPFALPLTGSVRFYLGLNPIAEIRIDANGRAALPARFDAAGSYLITAVYLGNLSYDTSQSAHLRQSVVPATSAAQAAATAPTPTAPATAAASPPAPAASAAAVAAEEARKPLTPAQARRAALAARLAGRRPLVVGRMRR
ncbi:Ig-like domain repeat protein [Paludisphaera sp.]|uniref:Ig-like domain repeat protein n=1 Tax=Paludisphaera sp. TaxID=2017432 RepID=UPI00301CFDFB